MNELQHFPPLGFYCLVFPPESRPDHTYPAAIVEFNGKGISWSDGPHSLFKVVSAELVSETPEKAVFRCPATEDEPAYEFELVHITMELWERARELWASYLPAFDALDDVQVWMAKMLR